MSLFTSLFGGSATPPVPTHSGTNIANQGNLGYAGTQANLGNMGALSGRTGGLIGSIGPSGTWTSTTNPFAQQHTLGNPFFTHQDPNTLPEMQMSLEDVHALWLVRFGGDWVKIENTQDAVEFNWARAANRLSNMRLLETDSSMGYYKLVPHTWK